MSKEVTKIGKKAVNRIVIGIEFMIIFGLAGGLAIFLLGVPLTGDLSDLATGIELIDENIGTGLGVIFFWALSTIIIGAIGIFLVVKFRLLIPFKSVDEVPDVPKRTFLITFIILGAIISFLFFVVNQALGFFGTALSAVDIGRVFTSLVEGDFTTFFVGIIFALIAGTVVVAVVNRTSKFQKASEDVGLPEV